MRTIIWIITLVALVSVIWWSQSPERENDRHMTKEAHAAIAQIMNRCDPHLSPRDDSGQCKGVRVVLERCNAGAVFGPACSFYEIYLEFQQLGVSLPPPFEAGYKPK
jgi:hypothetical protein